VSGSPTILVVGSLNRDYLCRVDLLPGPGETRLGSELALWCGGKGANQAVAAALVGAAHGVGVALVGAVGDDEDGRALLEGLRDAGVDGSDVAVGSRTRTGVALITVSGDGENTIVVSPGANRTVEPEPARAAVRRRAPAVVVTQGELTADVVAATIEEAEALGARVVLNLAPVIALDDTVLRVCDPLVVNEGEARALLGETSHAADPESLARALCRRARSVVVTAGAAGAWTASDGLVRHVPSEPAEVVDTTGAGDAFIGALAVGLALGRDLVASAAWGAAVAAYAVGRPGAQASFPRGGDLGGGQTRLSP
jgi:ribokinase